MARPAMGPVFQVFFYANFGPPPQGQSPGSNLWVAPEEYRWVRRDIPHMQAAPGGWALWLDLGFRIMDPMP